MTAEHFDVLVVGAGISGIGAGYRLQTECPGRSYAILEGRSESGGTWDLFRYPGIRSDSDMSTLGYPFRPWRDARTIADGPSILAYIRATAAEYGIDRHIRYSERVVSASWDSTHSRWTVEVQVGDDPDTVRYTCTFLYMCSGYYSYERGYLPDFAGRERFAGTVVHPQQWPEDLDYDGKRVVVIGSGATAVTLLPAMAERAAHVTMLQRSPTWITSLPAIDPVAAWLRRHLPERIAGRLARWNSVAVTLAFYQFCRRRPKLARRFLRSAAAKQLPEGYDLDPNFAPRYDPWDQRMCVVPDGDLFTVIKDGTASIVTDTIGTFTEDGIRLVSGRELAADIIVSATGLQLVALGGISIDVDGAKVDPGDSFVYRGFMLSDVPNLAMCVGYTNASWTLRADLTSQAVCRLLNTMAAGGHEQAVARLGDETLAPRALLDLSSGYVQRTADKLPKQGDKPPWRLRQNYVLDYLDARFGDMTERIEFPVPPTRSIPPTRPASPSRPVAPVPAARTAGPAPLRPHRGARVPFGTAG